MSKFPGLLVACLLAIPFAVQAEESFTQVEFKTLDKEGFVFPDDLNGGALNIVLLAIGTEQDNGTWQGDALVEWYAALDKAGLLNEDVKAWHFSVLKVPFFIKGVIRNGMAESYEGKLPFNQAGPIYIKDVEGFAEQAGIAIDGQPTIVLVTPDGVLHEQFKGEATEENLSAVSTAVAGHVAAGAG